MRRKWTDDDVNSLCKMWGNSSVERICTKLERSKSSVIQKVNRLKLGAFLDNSIYITKHQLFVALGINSDSYKNVSWLKNRGLKTHKVKRGKQTFNMILIDEFWKWAYENMNFLDFSSFQRNSLGKEPKWVDEKRRKDIKKSYQFKRTPWSEFEDKELMRLLSKYKYSYKELSLKLQRTEGAIQRRICDLGIKERPVKADNYIKWTESEYMMLGEMIKNGYSYELISEKISKSVKAIRGRVYNTYLTERLDKVRAIIGDGNFGDNAAPKQLKHKNLLSAEEKSEVKELMSRFIACLSADLDEIKKFNVYFQKDMCQNWDKYRGCKAKENGCDECISFVRLKPQFCKRCGKDFIEHGEHLYCQNCREARLKQAQRKYAILNQKGEYR